MAFKNTKNSSITSEHYEIYAEYSKVLRTWFVAYGVGVPALILSQKDLWQRLAASGDMQLIAILFITGVFLQVLIAIINKAIMWASYYGSIKPSFKIGIWHKASITLAECYFIDLIFDIATTTTYTLATYYCFRALKP